MDAWFDEQEVVDKDKHGKDVAPKIVVFFHLRKPAITHPAVPFEFDGPATERHMKDYPRQYEDFLKSKEPKESSKELAEIPQEEGFKS